jgi:hypothetical protein
VKFQRGRHLEGLPEKGRLFRNLNKLRKGTKVRELKSRLSKI